MEMTEEQKQEIIEFKKWIKEKPSLGVLLKEQAPSRILMFKSRFEKFHLGSDVLVEIAKQTNEDFLYGHFLAEKDYNKSLERLDIELNELKIKIKEVVK